MDAYLNFMAKQIAEEVDAIEDPKILHIYLTAIQCKRCKLCGATEGTCKNGIYQFNQCIELNRLVEVEKWIVEEDEE